MTEQIKGRTREDAIAVVDQFRGLVTGKNEPVDPGKLAVFSDIRLYPTRVKCATLAWQTLQAALEGSEETVTTE